MKTYIWSKLTSHKSKTCLYRFGKHFQHDEIESPGYLYQP